MLQQKSQECDFTCKGDYPSMLTVDTVILLGESWKGDPVNTPIASTKAL